MDTDSPIPGPASEVTGVRRRRRRRRRSTGHRARRTDRLLQAERIVSLAAAAVAIVLNVVFVMHAGGLWRDEASAVGTAAAPAGEFWHLAEFGPWPVAWLVVLRGWIGVATGDQMLRVLGLAGGLALPAAVWYALRRLTRAAPLASLALIAVNPEIIRWGASVGPWGLSAALGVLLLASIREASVAMTRRRMIIAGGIALAAMSLAPQGGALLAAVVAAAAAVAIARRRWREALVPVAIGGLAVVAWLPMLGLAGRRATWGAMAEAPAAVVEMASRIEDAASASGTVVVTCALGLVAMAIASAAQWIVAPDPESANRTRRGVASYSACAILLAPAAPAIGAMLSGSGAPPWFGVALVAFIAVGAEIAVASAAAARMARIALVALAVVVLVAGARPAWLAVRAPQTNVDAIAARLNADAAASDLVLLNPWRLATSVSRYYTGAAPLVTIPPIDDHRVYRYDLLREEMTSGDRLAALLIRVQRTLESGGQVWLVGGIDTPASGAPPARLSAPPLADTAWQAEPYEYAWSVEVGAFLQAHAADSQEVGVPSGGRYEDAKLAVLKGWK